MPARYAVYWAPPEGSALDDLGRRWFARDPRGGPVAERIILPGVDCKRLDALIRTPRRYGFHATLKAPFRLAAGMTADMLRAATSVFAAGEASVLAPPLKLGTIGAFIALIPSAPSATLDGLAADCVRELDRFRAPPAAAELARRQATRLDQRQEELLRRWGYPYVLDQFRFHCTLTERVESSAERDALLQVLQTLLAPLCREPLTVAEICLFRQDKGGENFVLDRRFNLAGPPPGVVPELP